MLPIAFPHPQGFTNPVVMRVSAILLPASAWDVTPIITTPPGAKNLAVFVTYTRGGAAGAVDLQFLVSPAASGVDFYNQGLVNLGTIVAGTDVQSRVQREYLTYQATGAGAEKFMYLVDLLGVIERLQLRARESGNAAAPGTLAVIGYFYD